MQLDTLKLISLCDYLTDVEAEWRDQDHTASKMVKALKGDVINGYFEIPIAGKVTRFDQNNVHNFVARIPPALAKHIMRHCDGPATIVPIPNSHIVSPSTQGFKTLDLAKSIAQSSSGKFTVAPALVFKEPQDKARNGGPRHADYLEDAYKVIGNVSGPIILLDDVCTSGGHMIGAYRRLHGSKSPVILACTFGRTTRTQRDNPIGLHVDNLPIT